MDIEDRNLRLVLLMDEFEYVTQNPNFSLDFFAGLRALAIHSPLALVTGTREELVDLCHSDAIKGSPFFNIFATVVLRPFEPAEATALIDGALAGTQVTFSPEDRAYLSKIAGGHPIFVQMTGYYCFEGYQMGLRGSGLRQHVEENFLQQAEPHFTYQWTHSSESERVTLLTLVALTREKERKPTQEQLTKVYPRAAYILPELVKRGLALEQEDRFTVFSPPFGDWLIQEISAEVDTQESEKTAQEWLEERGGVDRTTGDRIRQALPKMKKRYWPLLTEFLMGASAEVVASLITQTGGM
jgi:hypothetical protein